MHYSNFIVDTKDGTLLARLAKLEATDKRSGKSRSDGQDKFLTTLKAGGNPSAICADFAKATPPRLVHVDNTESFLAKGELPKLDLVGMDREKMEITLKLTNQHDVLKTIGLDINPGEPPVVKNSFYTKFCGQDVLVVVVAQSNNNGISSGVFYSNIVFNPQTAEVVKVLETGVFEDKETGEMISNDQAPTLAKLKADQHSEYLCKYLLQE